MNPFIPTDCRFEIVGFVEEFDDAETHKSLGSRRISEPDRPCGSPGRVMLTLTEPLHLVKGYRETPITIKASKKAPRKVFASIQIICGREKPRV